MGTQDPIVGSSASNKHDYGQMAQDARHDAGNYQGSYQEQIDALNEKIEELVKNQKHDGNNAPLINFNTDITGLFETVSVAPTNAPKSPFDQVKIYVNSTTYRLYWYDGNGNVWHYVTATV